MSNIVYLASPYTIGGQEQSTTILHGRYEAVMYAMFRLSTGYYEGWGIISPIVLWHNVAEKHDLPRSAQFYWEQNKKYIDVSEEIVVLMMDGWNISAGVAQEVGYAEAKEKQITYMDPEDWDDE